MKPLKTRVSLTLDENLMDEVKLLAEQDDRSVSQYINLIIREHLQYKCNYHSDESNPKDDQEQ